MRHRSGGHFDAEINQQTSQPAQQRYWVTLQYRDVRDVKNLEQVLKAQALHLICCKYRNNAIVTTVEQKAAFLFDASFRLCKQPLVNL